MPAPTGFDGARRALEVFVMFSVGVFMLVIFTREFIGELVAGFLYVGLAVLVPLGVVFMAAEYWNIPYTAGFLVAGAFYLIAIPGIVGQLVDPIFRGVGATISVLFLLGIGWFLVSKLSDSPMGR